MSSSWCGEGPPVAVMVLVLPVGVVGLAQLLSVVGLWFVCGSGPTRCCDKEAH